MRVEVFVRLLQSFAIFAKFYSALNNLQEFKLGKAQYVWILQKKVLRFSPHESFYLQKCVQLPKICAINYQNL